MIFCVDDDSAIRDIEVYTLQQTGFKAKGLSCGDELFLELKNVIPDLIILDIMMAGKDGIQILKELKSNQKYANIPVIMATAKGSEMDKIYGLDLGSDDYLVKPFRVDKSHSRETGGTGLGHSIVKHAAKIQNAKLTLESQENHGTRIAVVF